MGILQRIYKALFNPPTTAKQDNALRFGIIGAANIAPMALILAARSHPEVVIAGVAARDEQKAKAFAKKHDIDKVYFGPTGYQQLLDDPDIDVIYNPLPNGLHFEWSAKALMAGKHVLLEKPSTNSAEETQKLFDIAKSKGVVLLEAFHYRFHPAYLRLKEIVNSGELGKIKSVKSALTVPSGAFPPDDIRFNYALGGGALMDMGCYTISVVRNITGSEPIRVLSATCESHPDPKIDCEIDRGTTAVFEFPNDVTCEIQCDLKSPWRFGFIPPMPDVHITVQMEGGEAKLFNFIGPWIYHYISVAPKGGKKRTEKVYAPKEGKGEYWWTTYRWQLEVFVDQIRGRTPHAWVTEEDSVDQMKAIEMVYQKLGLPPRLHSEYVP